MVLSYSFILPRPIKSKGALHDDRLRDAPIKRHPASTQPDGPLEELIGEYDRWKHLRGESTKKSRAADLKALTVEYAKWKARQSDGGGGGRGEKSDRGQDALLRDSLEDFGRWKELREEEKELIRRRAKKNG